MVEICLRRVCVFSTCYTRIRQSSLSFLSQTVSRDILTEKPDLPAVLRYSNGSMG